VHEFVGFLVIVGTLAAVCCLFAVACVFGEWLAGAIRKAKRDRDEEEERWQSERMPPP
jgi:hypothetical protein